MCKVKFSLIVTLFVLLVNISVLANPTDPVVYTQGDKKITGWERDGNNKITIKIWLGDLTAEQKRVFKLAMNQWINWETRDTNLSKSNYGGNASNPDVMSGEELKSGESGRNMSESDKEGMNSLYNGSTIEVEYVDNKEGADMTAELSGEVGFGQGGYEDSDGDLDIDSGYTKFTDDLGSDFSWFYVTDSDGDGKITNADKDASGKSISDYTTATSATEYYYNKYDFYSLAKHEIGHALGFDHSVIRVPAPSAVFLSAIGVLAAGSIRRKIS